MSIVKDCIYRYIHISPLCKSFINTIEFQRLRNIKQLGLVHYVYPSAVHTRYEHSLGVMHLAGKVIDHLRSLNIDITDREKELVQLAALYHDIGHIAFSHLLDDILHNEYKVLKKHEDRSIDLLTKVNNRLNLLSIEEINQISKMIKGEYKEEKKPFLFQIVCDSLTGIDVDRMDYLQRDSYHCNLSLFQPDYIIECMNVRDGKIVFLEKAKEDIVLLYQTRRRMFIQVYRHKTVLCINSLFKTMLKDMNPQEWISDIDTIINTDDIEVMYRLKKDSRMSQLYERTFTKIEPNQENWDDGNKINLVTFIQKTR